MDGLAVPTTRRREDIAPVQRRLEQLLEYEGIPLGALVQEVAEIGLHRGVFEYLADHSGDATRRQRLELDLLGHAGALPSLDQGKERMAPIELIAAISDNQQDPGSAPHPAGPGRRTRPAS